MLDFVAVFIQELLNFVLANLFYFFYELCYWLQQAQNWVSECIIILPLQLWSYKFCATVTDNWVVSATPKCMFQLSYPKLTSYPMKMQVLLKENVTDQSTFPQF